MNPTEPVNPAPGVVVPQIPDGLADIASRRTRGAAHVVHQAPATQRRFVKSPAESMTLLTEVMEQPLDPSYAAARQRSQTSGWAAHGPMSWLAIGVVALLTGIGTVTAAQALRVPQPVMRETRALLEAQIIEHNNQIAALSAQIDQLGAEIAQLQATALSDLDPALVATIETDALHNGSAAVTGPGFEVSLTDGGGPLAEDNPESLVRDADLQRVISYLWAAGAEAIAVNDQRLTMTSAVRNAGSAILVDLVPLVGPTYTVRAIGSPEALQTGWEASGGPSYLQLLGTQYGVRSSAALQPYLELPSATGQSLRYAKALTSEP